MEMLGISFLQISRNAVGWRCWL